MSAVNTRHRDYVKWLLDWQKMRDVCAGQRAVQERSPGYLPRLSKQTDEEYVAYKLRGSFYGATARTVEALGGAIFRRDPDPRVSDDVLADLENIDLAGTPFDTFAKETVDEILKVGRCGVLVDMPPADTPVEFRRPYWRLYSAENIYNWWTISIGGMEVLARVVLRECRWELSPGDEFVAVEVERFRVLDLVDEGIYRQRLFQVEPNGTSTPLVEIFPMRAEEPLDYIPFCFFGARTLKPAIEKPPLLDMADINLSHWRMSVDYAHGLHFTALPTPWLSCKTPPTNKDFRIGSSEAWVLDENGRAGMLEFSGAGMGALKDAIDCSEERLAHLGAEVLTPEKRAAEAADALRIRSAGRTASLANIASTATWGFSKLATWHAWWRGESDQQLKDTEILLNDEFADPRLSAQDITALVGAYQAGTISLRTFVENAVRGEILEGRTVEEEIAEIEAEQDVKAEREALKAATDQAQQIGGALLETMKEPQPPQQIGKAA
jgi:Domain of unknown function (DUF4055)